MKKLSYLLVGTLLSLLFVNCTGKSSEEEVAGNLLNVQIPQIEKFVVITADESPVYKEADTNSPTLVSFMEECECDFPEIIVQWSDQQEKEGFSHDPHSVYAGQAVAVVGEEGDFYRISLLSEYCNVETGYIPKSVTEDIKSEPVAIERIEAEEWSPTLVVKEGKYKDLVLRAIPDEMDGESMAVGVLIDGVLAFPCNYKFSIWKDEEVKGIKFNEAEGLSLCYSGDMAQKDANGYEISLDPKKLSEEQIGQIYDMVTKQKPELVQYEYCFPMLEGGSASFWFNSPKDNSETSKE